MSATRADAASLAGRRVVLCGAGRMGGALLDGWLAAGMRAEDVVVLTPNPAQRLTRLGVVVNPPQPTTDADAVVVAVKPQKMAEALPPLRDWHNPHGLILSIAAGTPLATFEAAFGARAAVVRAMPNTPAAIGKGISVCCANAHAAARHRALASQLAAAVGAVEWIDDEPLMDVVTVLSGSGPAYVYYLVECMAAAGVRLGLDPAMAMRLARATAIGSGALLEASSEPADALRRNVTSPGGTTAAALSVLMEGNAMEQLFARAIEAGRDRGRELAG